VLGVPGGGVAIDLRALQRPHIARPLQARQGYRGVATAPEALLTIVMTYELTPPGFFFIFFHRNCSKR
jgi:hypothetical protein